MAEMSFPGPFDLILLITQATTYERRENLDDVNWNLTHGDPAENTQANAQSGAHERAPLAEKLKNLRTYESGLESLLQ